jgi:hypothetical protein
MPLKQKMGNITHNSLEINEKGAKGGMLSKLFSGGGLTSQSKTTAGSNKHGKRNGLMSSLPPELHGTGYNIHAKLNHSFTAGEASFVIPEELMHDSAARAVSLPTSITTLIDAASVLTEDFPPHPVQLYYQSNESYFHQDF